MKIVRILPSLEKIGPVQGTLNTLMKTDREQYETTVVALAPTGWGRYVKDANNLTADFEKEGIPVQQLNLSMPKDLLLAVPRLKQVIRELNPDIVHTQLLRPHIYGRMAGHALGKRIVSTIHNENDWVTGKGLSDRAKHYLDRVTIPYVHRFVAVSDTVKAYILQHESIPEEKISVINNGVLLDRFSRKNDRDSLRRELTLESDSIAIGTVARIDDQKDPDTFVRAAAGIAQKLPKARFFWIGSGPMRGKIEQRVHELGIEGSFQFLGERDDVPQLLRALDIFVLTSKYEGMPNALLEAMAAGLPCIASKVSGNMIAIQDKQHGRLFPVGDSDSLQDHILAYVNDMTEAQRLAVAGQARMKDEFSSSSVAKKYQDVYDQVLNENPL